MFSLNRNQFIGTVENLNLIGIQSVNKMFGIMLRNQFL